MFIIYKQLDFSIFHVSILRKDLYSFCFPVVPGHTSSSRNYRHHTELYPELDPHLSYFHYPLRATPSLFFSSTPSRTVWINLIYPT